MPSQITFSMSQCGTCHVTDVCKVRKTLLKTLSTTAHELNTDDEPGTGAAMEIITVCKRVIVTN